MVGLLNLYAQEKYIIKWSFNTNDKIFSHPIVDGNTVYFGSSDKTFYAIDIITGKQIWSYTTKSSIRSKPLINGDVVYFNSGDDIYALDSRTGKEIWNSINVVNNGAIQIDYWDYHSGSPAIHDGYIYFGLSSGELNGYNLNTGDLESQIIAIDSASIKCGLVIDKSVLYFGDWNGKVYAYDLKTGKKLWIYETYAEKLYDTFGQINTELIVYKDLLIFGGRNPELQVLDKKTGLMKWNYIEKDGGWISGYPIVENDTLYIGGSDNHKMFAFNVFTGENYWDYLFLNNNFSKPFLYKNYILFTTGDAYTVYGTSSGRGYLYALNRKDGNIVNTELIGGNIYSSPAVSKNDVLFFGSEDKNLYAIDLNKFLISNTKLEGKGYNSVDILKVSPKTIIDSVQIDYKLNYETNIIINVTDLSEKEIKNLFTGIKEKGEHSIKWEGKDDLGNIAQSGHYFIEISSGEFYKRIIIQKN